ncbi:MAG: hypothetical protein V9G98_01945 [Candidatus Competibacter sp.]
MAGRDEVDVVATLLLQVEHHAGQRLRRNCPPRPLLADFPILTKHATQVAPGKKDRPRSSPAAQRIFLAMMWTAAMHHRLFAGVAHHPLERLPPVHPAITSAQIALFQPNISLGHPSFQLAAIQQRQIRWPGG